MIKTNIQRVFTTHYSVLAEYLENIYIVDYTEQTKNSPLVREVEFFSPHPPADIAFFSIINTPKLCSTGIIFNNSSFILACGDSKSHCEAVFFPSVSNDYSWILFCELKYSYKPYRNNKNLPKAIKQLYRSHYYYFQENIFKRTNTCFLIASIPPQPEPFANFSLSPSLVTKLKLKRNIILRMTNSVEIVDDKILNV